MNQYKFSPGASALPKNGIYKTLKSWVGEIKKLAVGLITTATAILIFSWILF